MPVRRNIFQSHGGSAPATKNADHKASNETWADQDDDVLDSVIIGAGFAGCYLLHRLRQEGFAALIVEAGSGLGGVWHWNTYPGARVDSQYPCYQLSVPEVVKSWEWSEQYPGVQELREYFKHVDKVLDISRDTIFNTTISAAHWNEARRIWQLTCDDGTVLSAKFMHSCLGFAAKRYFPDWNLDDFGGQICHSSFWPAEGVEMSGRKVGVVGTGATGVQIAQEAAKYARELDVFVRTPNTCLRMNQQSIPKQQAREDMVNMASRLDERLRTSAGFSYDDPTKKLFEDMPEEREAALSKAWRDGGFRLMFAYTDLLTDERANRYVYDFWAREVRRRIQDPKKRELLAPLEPLHPWAAKRPSLEQDYYEQMDRDHVRLVDVRKTPVSHLVHEGLVTEDGQLHELDILVLATGFDSLGCFSQIHIEGVEGNLQQKWSGDDGVLSYLGLSVHNFPNLFYTYGPLAPTAYSNGPTLVEAQSDWIVEAMKRMRDSGKTRINAQMQPERDWRQTVNDLHAKTVRHNFDSSYVGSNIPGRRRQALNCKRYPNELASSLSIANTGSDVGGLLKYIDTIHEKMDNDFEGFDLS